ncbi:MAG: tetratricopeptide repeat protein [Acidobacteriota bacterium]
MKDSGPAVRLLQAEASHWAGKRDTALKMLESLEKEANGDARVLFTLGRVCARLGLYERAEAAFRVVLGAHPGDADVLFELGRTHAARQDYSRAVYLLAQARQRAPKRPDILLALARAAEDAGYYGDSALAYDEYLQLQPGDDKVRRDRARVYGYTGTRLEEGLKEMAWYVKKHPNDPVGHYHLAQFSWRAEPEKALEQLATALRLDPNLGPAHVSRAWLLHRLGRTADCVPHLQAAIRITPKNVRALDQLGLAYLALDQPAEAEKALRRAWAIAPEDPEVLMHLGRALMALGREAEAQRFLEKYQQVRPQRFRDPRKEPGMIELATLPEAERRTREIARFRGMASSRPDDPKLQMHLAELLMADGRTNEAAGEFRKLLAMNADSGIWEEAGKSLLRFEQHELAREFLARAAAERPTARLDYGIALFFTQGPQAALKALDTVPEAERNGDFLLMKARILEASGQTAEAEKLLLEGLRHSGSRPEVAQQAALMLVRHDHTAEALDLLNRALQATPDDAGLLLTRAIVLGLMNRNADAARSLEQIQSRWPELDRAYLVHGLVLERQSRPGEARQKIQTALALGSQDLAARCALARLKASPAPDGRCDCVKGLRELLLPACAGP